MVFYIRNIILLGSTTKKTLLKSRSISYRDTRRVEGLGLRALFLGERDTVRAYHEDHEAQKSAGSAEFLAVR